MGASNYDGAHKYIENVKEKLESTEEKDDELKPEDLMKELRDSGEKFNEEDVVFVVKQKNGKLAWLEKGGNTAGWEHIKIRHAKQFKDIGIDEKLIPDLVREAILHGRIIGKQGKGSTPGDIYMVDFMGKTYSIMIVISSNGFIITAHPKSL